MRNTPLVLSGFALALVIAIPQSALAQCTVTQSTPFYKTTILSQTYYLVVLGCDSGICPFAEYLYEETNNIEGLQRHDGLRDDTCGNSALADLQIW